MTTMQYNQKHNKFSKTLSYITSFIRKNRFLAIVTIFVVFLYVGMGDIKHLSTETLKIYTKDSPHTFKYLKSENSYLNLNNKEDREKLNKIIDAANEAFQRDPGVLFKAMGSRFNSNKGTQDQDQQ